MPLPLPHVATLGLAALALTADTALILALELRGPPTLPGLLRASMAGPVLAGHLVVTLTLYGLYRLRPVWFADAPGASQLLALMTFLGPVGTLVGSLAAGLAATLPRTWLPVHEPAQPDTAQAMAAARPQTPRPTSVDPQSLCDVFRHGSLDQRRKAVALIGANFQPQFAEALRMALRDEHNAIRVQAGMVLLQIEDEFARHQHRLQSLSDGLGQDHGFEDAGLALELARLHDQQAYSGLLDGPRTRQAQSAALRAYRQHLEAHPDDLEAIAAAGRLLVRAGQHAAAAAWLGEQLGQGRTSTAILSWYVEALYRSQRYGEARAVFLAHGDRLSRHLPPDSPLQGVVALWRADPAWQPSATGRGGHVEPA